MRISFVTPEYPPGPRLGGIATHFHEMAGALTRAGHEVQVVTPGQPGESCDDGITVSRVAIGSVLPPRAEDILSYRRLSAVVLRRKPDVLQAPEWMACASGLNGSAETSAIARFHCSVRSLRMRFHER